MRFALRRPRIVALLAVALAVVLAAGGLTLARHARNARLAARLLATYPQDVTAHPELVQFAIRQARPLFASHCAACHGKNMRGNPAIGAADLVDGHWLWGDGTVFQIERIVLYGIRSDNPKTLNVTDMPAFGVMGRLTDGQINDLVQYLLKLNHRPYDVAAANTGAQLFQDNHFGCYDCHGATAQGNSDYGAPNLTVNTWNNGGDPRSLYDSIYYGRHRIMPAWQGVLSLEQIRALAVYIHTVSAKGASEAARASGTAPAPAAGSTPAYGG